MNTNETSNPLFQSNRFKTDSVSSGGSMTVQGTINKASLSFLFLMVSAYYSWTNPHPWFLLGGLILGLLTALITIFKKEWSPVTVPLYAFFEGLALGAISLFFEQSYPGIVSQAVFLTFCVLGVMLSAYRLEWIRVTPRFRKMVTLATMGIALFYLLNMILSFWGPGFSIVREATPLGIGFSLFVVGLAAFNLVLDFDFIEKASKQNFPKYMEWFAAFGLLVTLIWLYLEILRLLGKTRRQ